MGDAPDDAVGQQPGQGAVDGSVRLAQDACQLCRVDEWHPAEEMEQPLFGKGHISNLPKLDVCPTAPVVGHARTHRTTGRALVWRQAL